MAQAAEEDFKVFSEHPRLLLNRQRLRLLQRERQRQSMRWEQFHALVSGGAAMPEPGFALALYYRASGEVLYGRRAVEWAAGPGSDVRQVALVWDWCQDAMSEAQARAIAEKLERGLAGGGSDLPAVRSRALAAIALAERLPDRGEGLLRWLVGDWWRARMVPQLRAGRDAIPRDDIYPLLEMLHALRDNLNIDLREDAAAYFKTLPIYHLASHYPPPYPAAENEYRIPVYKGSGEPDLTKAALSRVAELAMLAYDTNALENQYLQGWLMQDRFLLRSGFGSPYEFLWANPYQPGLSYFHVPLVFHDERNGHVFARSSWDDNATWVGFFDGQMQLFEKGRIRELKPGTTAQAIRVGPATFLAARAPMRFQVDGEAMFLLGLKPRGRYQVEVDDEEMREEQADAGGTLVLAFPEGRAAGVRIKETAGRRSTP